MKRLYFPLLLLTVLVLALMLVASIKERQREFHSKTLARQLYSTQIARELDSLP